MVGWMERETLKMAVGGSRLGWSSIFHAGLVASGDPGDLW
jgi:hypothetical protein